MNSIENIECVPTGKMPIKNEEKPENDIETEMAGIKRRESNTRYHKLHSEKLKQKRRLKFILNQKEKLKKIKLTNTLPFTRKCPSCNTDLYYINLRNLNIALKTNGVCKHCCLKPRHINPPHNKGIYKRTEADRKLLERTRQLKINFGITKEEYDCMVTLQNDRCKICNIHKNELKKSLYVDHCHITGKIRGLLCQKCNSGLGMFNDNINLLNSATNYLSS